MRDFLLRVWAGQARAIMAFVGGIITANGVMSEPTWAAAAADIQTWIGLLLAGGASVGSAVEKKNIDAEVKVDANGRRYGPNDPLP